MKSATLVAGFVLFITPALSTALKSQAVLPPGWARKGCYSDTANPRTLGHLALESSSLSVENCIAQCVAGGYHYAGVEYGQECYCDYSILQSSTQISNTSCSMTCQGSTTETCGGPNAVEIYWSGASDPSAPTQLVVGNMVFRYEGCWSDPGDPHVLDTRLDAISSVTLETCAVACRKSNYAYFGTENGQECWCGNYLNTASPTPSSAQSCASPCLGDPTELCGSPSFLTVYYFIGIKGGSSDTCRAEKSASVFDIFLRPKNTYTSGVVIKQYVDHVDEQGKIFYYLSSCVSDCNVNGQNFVINGGFLYVNGTDPSTSAPFFAKSLPLIAGETPMMASTTGITGDRTSPGFCLSLALDQQAYPSPGFFQWVWIEYNVDINNWATCANKTAGGRQDLVWFPYKNHPNYDLSQCTPVYLVTDFPLGYGI